MVAFSGYLQNVKKADLQDIAEELRLKVLEDASRVVLIESIRQKLVDEPDLQRDARFSGITGIVRSRAYPSNGDSPKLTPASSKPHGSRKSISGGAVSLQNLQDSAANIASGLQDSAANLASGLQESAASLASDLVQRTREQLEDLPERAEEVGGQLVAAADRQLALVKQLDSDQVSRAVTVWTRRAETQIGKTARAAQSALSNGWAVTALTLDLEFLFVLAASIPLAKQYSIGPFEWWSRPWTSDTPWTVTLPDLLVLRQFDILEPILVWVFTSIIVPYCAAHLVVFPKPRPHTGRRSSDSHYLLGLNPPSVLTFSIIRLAVNVYNHEISSRPLVSFSSDIVHRFGSFQLLCSAVALAFAVYELIAEH